MRRPLLTAAALVVAAAAPGGALADRPMGAVSSWGHELNQDELPGYRPDRLPVPPGRWYRTIDRILADAGGNGMWFTGPSALPFPPLPLAPNEPVAWRTPARFAAAHRATGLSWDVAYEVWAARNLIRRGAATVIDPTVSPFAYTQRIALTDPAYRRASLAEIRRIVPTVRRAPYVFAYQGSDEPMVRLPRGAAALGSAYARTMRAQVRARYGWSPPSATARPTTAAQEGLRWLAYNRWLDDAFVRLKRDQADLIRRLDPGALVETNDYAFIRGFVPWDYTRLGEIADMVEGDPYVSYAERLRPGRGRYNPGFAAKFLSDLTGRRTRIILQAFTYAGYTPQTADLYTWASQALRAGATDLSLYASDNPRVSRPVFYRGMLGLARSLRGVRLPDPPVDRGQLVVYATASEKQGRPALVGDDRYMASGDALYATYALLGERAHAAFAFDSDTRLLRDPARLAAARVVWLPRADTLDEAFATAVERWVERGGTLVVTDPGAFARTPSGASLAAVRQALIGAPLGPPRAGDLLRVGPGALGSAGPAQELLLPADAPVRRAFAAVPDGATVPVRFLDDAPAVISRPVGSGRVIAFATDPMQPASLVDPLDLDAFVRSLETAVGARLDHPAWSWTAPGTPEPGRPSWTDLPAEISG